ncbi:OmpA family protein [Carnimonas nigrificans]|uniref:OmpA family protein n=1 Tax=Carnimonas nigrificans TaxID=64323 RepID=UPI000471772C|nr:OmpA family protein [Carnimonas nigrificans]
MNKSATGLVLGSALVLGLSGCASNENAPTDGGSSWYQNPLVCGAAGALIGGGLGYSVSGSHDEGTGAAIGGVAGGTIAALLCKSPDHADADSDGDGVPDSIDECPGTPAGVAVDAKGCPLDSDGDGVPDYLDECPGTPAGTEVDAQGCPVEQAPERPTLVLNDIHFAFDSSKLSGDSQQTLNVVAQRLVENSDVAVRIEGHTDSTGTEAYNKRLSQRRADSVAQYLTSQGVDASRLTTEGFGESRPVADNSTREGRAQNRRVEIAPVDGGDQQ